jgi:cytidylate kinase
MPNKRSEAKSKISGWLHIKSAETYRQLAKERGITVTQLLEEIIAPYEEKRNQTKKKGSKNDE